MRNPLIKRLPRELKTEIGKYIVIFLFLAGTIALVSGFLVANGSMCTAYDESFDKYNIEDGNFELKEEASETLLDNLQKEKKVVSNFYVEEDTKEVDSTLRIFMNRKEIDKICLMSGRLPKSDSEIAIDRLYAKNNKLHIGDKITVGGKKLKITGMVALSDYSALYQNTSDMMFDAVKFGAGIMTEGGFASFGDAHLHYSYSWKYDKSPSDEKHAKEKSEDFLKILVEEGQKNGNLVTNYIPEYTNQAILFTGDDIKGDNSMMTIFLYIVIIIIAFIFAITTSNTISKEANVIGTLRASGYSKTELVKHYMTMPVLVIIAAAVIGNIFGYTYFKSVMAEMYYNSYCLPTYVTRWNADAFVKTTVVPVIIMTIIIFTVLIYKMQLSPLQFIRRDLSRKTKKKAFRLNTKIGIIKRFRLRVIFQNMPNYITIVIGVFLANIILLFGICLTPLLNHFQKEITSNMLCDYQYVLKSPQETNTEGAEKFCLNTLKTPDGRVKSEDAIVYGIEDNSKYVDLNFDSNKIYISNSYAEKYRVKKGDKITLKDPYADKKYTFTVGGIHYYPAGIAVFMSRSQFNKMFDNKADSFNGYFSNKEITDIDSKMIATTITVDDMTKTSRQLKASMGEMVNMLLVFGVAMFMLIIYLLSKIIIEKNSQSISMTKILGYSNGEINGIYILTTSIVVIISLLITIPLTNSIMGWVMELAMSDYAGWLPYYVPFSAFINMAVLGIASYAVIAFMQVRKIKKIPLADALKNAE